MRHIVLKTGMAGGKMVYLDDKGGANPLLRANVGDVVEIQHLERRRRRA